jgi:hypothetical protein
MLINPQHPRFSDLQIDPLQPFVFDERMFQATK